MRVPLVPFDVSFAHDYTVAIQPEPAGHENVIEFPTADHSRPESLLVRVEPHRGTSWLGLFRGGGLTHAGKTGVYTWPTSSRLCVVCAGAAYLLAAQDPKSYEELDAGMVIDVLPLPEHGIIVFADPWEVRAYGDAGLAWRTGRIAIDGLRLTGTQGVHLKGIVDSFEDDEVPFQVNLKTGRVEGGLPVS